MDGRHAEVISRMIWSNCIYDPVLSDFLYLRGPFREEIDNDWTPQSAPSGHRLITTPQNKCTLALPPSLLVRNC